MIASRSLPDQATRTLRECAEAMVRGEVSGELLLTRLYSSFGSLGGYMIEVLAQMVEKLSERELTVRVAGGELYDPRLPADHLPLALGPLDQIWRLSIVEHRDLTPGMVLYSLTPEAGGLRRCEAVTPEKAARRRADFAKYRPPQEDESWLWTKLRETRPDAYWTVVKLIDAHFTDNSLTDSQFKALRSLSLVGPARFTLGDLLAAASITDRLVVDLVS